MKFKEATYIPSPLEVFFKRFIRYTIVSGALHVVTVLSAFLLYYSLKNIMSLSYLDNTFKFCLWCFCGWIGLALPTFSQLDAFGRYQNYKLIKDSLYSFGYDERLVKPFMYSNCQRIAIAVAAQDLGYSKLVEAYFYKQGYRWYHLLPDNFVKDPLVIFTKKFWDKILFTKYYQFKYFYW